MRGCYEVRVHENGRKQATTEFEAMGIRLDSCMFSPYTAHIVVGRNGSEELLFVSYDRTQSDRAKALREACGVYCCKVNQWPTFVICRGEIHDISVSGLASPECLEFTKHRQMLILTKVDIDNYDQHQ